MRSTQQSIGVLAALVVSLGACGTKEAQTDEQVQTKTSAGEASTSISGDSADKRGQALVRVVNAVPAMYGLTVRSDDAHMLPSVDYKKVTAYTPIDKNWPTFEVGGQPGTPYAPVETNREMLTDGFRYTMVVMPGADGVGFQTRVIRDDISDDQTKAHLRVIHAAEGVDEVNVIAKGGERLFDGINFKSEAGFKDVNPWNGTLEFRTENDKTLLGTLANVNLRGGQSYTVVLARGKNGKLEPFWFEDQQVGP